MTDEIFRYDGYGFEFEANVVSVNGDEVVLDCTAFYPGGGGQVCDTGVIHGIPVTEAYYNKAGNIVHRVPGNNLQPGERVWCSVDWDRRYDLMQGHTGEHLLFCSLKRQCPDLTITKIMISPESKYVIVSHDLTWDQIREAQRFANKAIVDNLAVTKSVMDRDDPELENVRIKLVRIPEGEEISVVAIGDIDLSACDGIHVMETSELEMLVIDRKVSAGKDGVAIHFKVGQVAKDAAADLASTALAIVDDIGCNTEDLVRAVANMRHELDLDARLLKKATRELAATMLSENVNGIAVHYAILPGTDRATLTDVAEKVKSKGGVALIVGVTDTLSVIMASGSSKVDCRKLLPEALKQFGGRGGGKPNFAQGGVADASVADDIIKVIKDLIKLALR